MADYKRRLSLTHNTIGRHNVEVLLHIIKVMRAVSINWNWIGSKHNNRINAHFR